ncbi:MAG TPA: hypothetical protein DHW42_09720 [Candidatus Marinimicrobia bacterium]|nr:hypothetical protein [Candidatus Neomarinimicrobiota bacterium]
MTFLSLLNILDLFVKLWRLLAACFSFTFLIVKSHATSVLQIGNRRQKENRALQIIINIY